jgi:hypothetical protein
MNERLAALDFIAACLSVRKTPEITAALDQAIASGSINWQRVIGLANTNLATPTLWTELRSRDPLRSIPPDVRDYLGEFTGLTLGGIGACESRRSKRQARLTRSASNPCCSKAPRRCL